MKAVRLLVALGMTLALPMVAHAKCPDGQVLKRVGSLQTATANITTSGADVQAISLDCGGSACLAGLYDADTVGASTAATVVAEVGGAANSYSFIDLTDSPLFFAGGVTFVDDGNVDGITLLSCSAR